METIKVKGVPIRQSLRTRWSQTTRHKARHIQHKSQSGCRQAARSHTSPPVTEGRSLSLQLITRHLTNNNNLIWRESPSCWWHGTICAAESLCNINSSPAPRTWPPYNYLSIKGSRVTLIGELRPEASDAGCWPLTWSCSQHKWNYSYYWVCIFISFFITVALHAIRSLGHFDFHRCTVNGLQTSRGYFSASPMKIEKQASAVTTP